MRAGLISAHDLENALVEHKRTGERLGAVLVRMNLTTEKQLAMALAVQLGFPYVTLTESPPAPSAVVLIPKEVALKCLCVAVSLEKDLLTVAMSDPLLFSLTQDLELRTGYRIKEVVSTRSDILQAIQLGYHEPGLATTAPSSGSDEETFSPVATLNQRSEAGSVDLIALIVTSAIKSGASEIHVEPMEKLLIVRQRIDGMLKEMMDLPKSVHEGLIARLKTMAGMDTAEKRLPQDGRLRSTADDGVEIDFRVSTLRTQFGEKVVMRILDARKDVPVLEEIGMSATALTEVRRFLRHPHGMILVVGPSRSGRSTTLASALSSLRSEKTNIVTIEDPIEYQIPGVNQTQVDEQLELTFASSLRSILRQDPDVILLGEIPDAQTATIALQAAQMGHLLLSTLHADDAPSTVRRLMDIGAEPNVIANAVIGIVAQRLVRRLCRHCRRQYTLPPDTLRALNMTEEDAGAIPFYRAVGCDQCNHTGYRGRIGIFEVMKFGDEVRRLISSCAPIDQIREAAFNTGMTSLAEDGLAKVKSGITTPEELIRVVPEAREMRTLCSDCGSAVAVGFNACPSCGKRLGGGCPHCGRALQVGWSFCPYCARSTSEVKRPKRLHGRVDGQGREGPHELPPTNIAEFKK